MLPEYESVQTKNLPCFPKRFFSKKHSLFTKIWKGFRLLFWGNCAVKYRTVQCISAIQQHHTDSSAQIWKQDSVDQMALWPSLESLLWQYRDILDPSCFVHTYVGVTKLEDKNSAIQDTSVNMAKYTSKGVCEEHSEERL